ncbi:MAG TPA: amidohydrolase family protein [Anaerolineae bacterium]|nr:amidohydrolase family protein [Anaerolineae bacterium]
MARLKIPGLVDVHVHLREPGGEHKEDIASGSAAALAGGVLLVLDMPNTYPPAVDGAALALKRSLAREKALCDIGFFAGASETNAAEAAALARQAVGLKIYLDQTYGPLRMRSLAALLAHFRTWPAGRPIAVHAEGLSAATAIGLARVYGRRLHLCHVSRADEIALVRAAKESGASVTCEVTPHHLFLTEADAERLGPYGSMKPPLASEADRAALWANLDVVDCIATDHAPHTAAEKEGDAPPPGVPGLETMLPLLLTAVAERRLTLERMVQLTHDAPLRIFGLPEPDDSWVEVDPAVRHTLGAEPLLTRCGWTPFQGMPAVGKLRRVVLRGQTAFEGRVLARPGSGLVVGPPAPHPAPSGR